MALNNIIYSIYIPTYLYLRTFVLLFDMEQNCLFEKSFFLEIALAAKPRFTLFNCYWPTFAFWENHNTTSKA